MSLFIDNSNNSNNSNSNNINNNEILQLSGGREMVDDIRINELISLLNNNNNITNPTKINLSNKSFSYLAAEILSNYIKQYNNSIQYVDISDIIAGRHEDEALKVLEIICNTLSGNNLIEVNVSDNALGRKGIIACQNILQGKNLQKLYFCNNGLSAEASELITEILLNNGCPPLEVLHFYNNMSGAVGAKSSSQLVSAARNTLRDFRYSATRSGVEGCLPIAEALCETSNLTHLDLSDNSFGEDVIESLATAISQQEKLIYLNLRDGGLGEDGTREILKSLHRSRCPLQHLDISGNDLTDDIISDLVRYLKSTPTIQSISLDDSEFTIDGCRKLSQTLKTLPNLQTVSITTSQLTAGCVLLIANAVSKVASFRQLLVDGNQICSNGVEHIQKVLSDAGKELGRLDDNDEDGEDDLEEVEGDDATSPQDEEDTGLETDMSSLQV